MTGRRPARHSECGDDALALFHRVCRTATPPISAPSRRGLAASVGDRLGGGLKQDGIDDRLVLESSRGDRCRKRKDDVEVGNRQQVGFSRGTARGSGWPLTPRTMPIPAGIIGDPRHAAVIAGLDVAAERVGSAPNNGAHHPPLDATVMTGMVTTIGVAMPAQDIGNVDGGSVRADVGGVISRIPEPLSCRWRHLQR